MSGIDTSTPAAALEPTRVVVVRAGASAYPAASPFHPSERYPEYAAGALDGAPNPVYAAVREAFRLAGLDHSRFGTPDWNPLGCWIRPGQSVLLKPNFVSEGHPRDPEGWVYTITHGSIIRAVADYVFVALEGRGKVIVADAPQTDSSFAGIVRALGLDGLAGHYRERGLDFALVDLRRQEWRTLDGVVVERRDLPGDPLGYCAFDLGEGSELAGHPGSGRYYGADYDAEGLNRHHTAGRHEYLLSGTAIRCDVVFSLPKLKTHKKAGITASLKNLVGINGDKNWLPHHTEGTPSTRGDERPDLRLRDRVERRVVAHLRKLSLRAPVLGTWMHRRVRGLGKHVFGDTERVIRSGNWWGNDTVWRMCLDLNKCLFYGTPDGALRPPAPANRKTHLALVDGIVAGEGSGPLNPDPVRSGVVLFGSHPASVDAACAYLMGFDPDRIPVVREAFRCVRHPLAEWTWRDLDIVSSDPRWCGKLPTLDEATLRFRPHFGWAGHIERRPPEVPPTPLVREKRHAE